MQNTMHIYMHIYIYIANNKALTPYFGLNSDATHPYLEHRPKDGLRWTLPTHCSRSQLCCFRVVSDAPVSMDMLVGARASSSYRRSGGEIGFNGRQVSKRRMFAYEGRCEEK